MNRKRDLFLYDYPRGGDMKLINWFVKLTFLSTLLPTTEPQNLWAHILKT
jgi:hypothetical protein